MFVAPKWRTWHLSRLKSICQSLYHLKRLSKCCCKISASLALSTLLTPLVSSAKFSSMQYTASSTVSIAQGHFPGVHLKAPLTSGYVKIRVDLSFAGVDEFWRTWQILMNLTKFDRWWRNLTYRQILTNLTNFDELWRTLTNFDKHNKFCQFLTNFDAFWQIL